MGRQRDVARRVGPLDRRKLIKLAPSEHVGKSSEINVAGRSAVVCFRFRVRNCSASFFAFVRSF